MEFDFLLQFQKRMKIVGIYTVWIKNSIQKTTWKQYGFEGVEEQANITFALLLFIMEQSLKEEACTIDDLGSFLDVVNMTYFKKSLTYDQCKGLGDFIVNVILADEGRAMFFKGYDFEKGEYESIPVSYVANRIIYLDEEVKRTSYYLTDDGYNLMLSTLEIEANMKLTIHEMIFKLHLEKATYDKAVDDIKNVFNMLLIQFQKIMEAMGKIRQNALGYSVQDYRALLEENLNAIEDTGKRFMAYREKVKENVTALEDKHIHLEKLDKKELHNLEYLKIIERYLNRALEEHQKILSSHFDMKLLYTKELESLSQMAYIKRFHLENDFYEYLLSSPEILEYTDYFLRPLFNQAPEKTYNLNLAFLKQTASRKKQEEEELFIFDEEEWSKEQTEKKKERLKKYYGCVDKLLSFIMEKKDVTLKEIKEALSGNIQCFVPSVEIFKEVMVELIKVQEIVIEELKAERKESLAYDELEFQLNICILDVIKEHPEWDRLKTLSIVHIREGEPVEFVNVVNEAGEKKRILCSDVRFQAVIGEGVSM